MSMMSESTYTAGPSTQPTFIKPLHTKIPPPQTPLASDHAHWMDLSTHISSLGTCMEEPAVVSDTQFYSMEDCMDQYQFEYLKQRIERIEDCLESQHEEMMAYLCFLFPPPLLQP
ncbi:hypothetical protein VitviT2T_026560 [Vitis vinifera]|uniref:Uncharacterized protein n=1 Tax=Vitis vinifera TaxID=29760 RepID=A0ABY9DPQ1_VITVI|nr:hypothetical protein VitviT2T_026560 [Vitis vinifera]